MEDSNYNINLKSKSNLPFSVRVIQFSMCDPIAIFSRQQLQLVCMTKLLSSADGNNNGLIDIFSGRKL